MINIRTTWLPAAILASSFLSSGVATAQFRSVSWKVDQLPQSDGTTIYRMGASQFGYTFFGVPEGGASLTAPNGTVFPGSSNEVNFSSFADLGAVLFGDWVATEQPTSGSARTYTVRITPYTLNDVLSNTPFITSPITGSTVPADFVVKWDPNNPTSSRGIAYGGPGLSISPPQFGVDGVFSVGFHTQLLQPPPVPFPFLAFVQSVRPNPSVVNRSSSLNGQSIVTSLAFNAYSQRATYQVVPEPRCLVLTSLALVFFGCACIRRR
jgi:hypothetical protein